MFIENEATLDYYHGSAVKLRQTYRRLTERLVS